MQYGGAEARTIRNLPEQSTYNSSLLYTEIMVRAVKGHLVKCDPSIKALIVDIDSKRHDIIIEELDDTNLLVSSDKVQFIKSELDRILAKNTYNSLEEEEKEMQN